MLLTMFPTSAFATELEDEVPDVSYNETEPAPSDKQGGDSDTDGETISNIQDGGTQTTEGTNNNMLAPNVPDPSNEDGTPDDGEPSNDDIFTDDFDTTDYIKGYGDPTRLDEDWNVKKEDLLVQLKVGSTYIYFTSLDNLFEALERGFAVPRPATAKANYVTVYLTGSKSDYKDVPQNNYSPNKQRLFKFIDDVFGSGETLEISFPCNNTEASMTESEFTLTKDLTVKYPMIWYLGDGSWKTSGTQTVNLTVNGEITIADGGSLSIQYVKGEKYYVAMYADFKKPITVESGGSFDVKLGDPDPGDTQSYIKYDGTDGSLLTIAEGASAELYSITVKQENSTDPAIVANGELSMERVLPPVYGIARSEIHAKGPAIEVGSTGDVTLEYVSIESSEGSDAPLITVKDGGELNLTHNDLSGYMGEDDDILEVGVFTSKGSAPVIQAESGATLNLGSAYITAEAEGTPAITLAKDSKLVYDDGEKWPLEVMAKQNENQAVEMAGGVTVTRKSQSIEIPEQSETDSAAATVDNRGNLIVPVGTKVGGTVTTEQPAIITGDNQVVQGSNNEPPIVDYETGDYTLPQGGGSVTDASGSKTEIPGGSTIDPDSEMSFVTITFDSKGGSSVAAQKVQSGQKAVKPAVPTRSGYSFDGWYTSTDGGNTLSISAYDFNSEVTSDITLYAKWTRNSSGGSSGSTRYTVSVEDTDNGTVKVSPTRASKGSTVTITVTPDEGYELDKLIVTDKNGDKVKLTDKGDGKYTFKMPSSKVTVEATFAEIGTEPETPVFTDVPTSAYYYDAVLWAVENGVTEGTSATTFSPDMSCTRAQMVTFLWRAAGSPEPVTTTNPFTDVNSGVYYYDAVLWAVEQGITSGTSATTFAPDATCTRAQTVTFLYRAAGSPAVSGGSFSDVSADAYYADAVAWAVSESVTVGTSDTTFSPDMNCTRAQIVTFMYRAAQ